MLALNNVESANAGAYMHAHHLFIVGRDLQAGSLNCLFSRREGEMNEAAHFLDFFFLDEIQRVEVFDFCRYLAGVFGRVKLGNPADAALTGEQVLPDFFGFVADSANQSNTSNDNSAHQLLTALRVLANVINRVLDGTDFFGIFIRDFDFECLFERHHQFDGVQRVGAKVVHERSAGGNFAFVHAQLFHNDLLHFFINGCHIVPRLE